MLAADWSTMRDKGPFSLLFLDAREPKDSGADTILAQEQSLTSAARPGPTRLSHQPVRGGSPW